MLRILHTEWSDGWGGQERRVVSEMRGLAERGHHLVLATRPEARIAREAALRGLSVLTLPMTGRFDAVSIIRLARFLRAERIQIVNTHSGIDSWIGAFAARLAGVPVLVRTRHLRLPLKRNWLNFVHYMADRVVSCGESMRRFLVDECGFPESQVVSIPTGIDFEAFVPRRNRDAMRAELGIGTGEMVILMVGIIRGVKRHAIALEACARIASEFPGARLVLAGDGPMRPDMEALAGSLGISERVLFLGHREDVADLMGAADVLLLTSRSEGVPQAVAQAMGLGLPVVATSVGGVPELIEHEKTGLLVPPEDPQAVAQALTRILRDPDSARRLGAAARAHARAEFSLKGMLDKTEALFRALLAQKGVAVP